MRQLIVFVVSAGGLFVGMILLLELGEGWVAEERAKMRRASGKTQSWIHVIGFALIMATTVYVILDLEHPRLGIIRVDAFDRVLVDVRQSMH